ncbi:hypothetical protein HB777_23520 [Mesorhizobium loti]|nr:hypothetical protein HB777_23520 [Mesorhizobium loti]
MAFAIHVNTQTLGVRFDDRTHLLAVRDVIVTVSWSYHCSANGAPEAQTQNTHERLKR